MNEENDLSKITANAIERKEHKVYGDTSTFMSVTAFLFLGLMIIWTGVYYLNSLWNILEIDSESYHITKLIISLLTLIFAWNIFSKSMITEGLLILIASISSIVFSMGSLLFDAKGYGLLDILFALGIFISALIILRKKNYIICIASIILAFSMSLMHIYDSSVIIDVLFIISGLMYTYYAFGNIIYGETGKNIFRVTQNIVMEKDERIHDRPYELSIVVGLYLFATLIIMIGIEYFLISEDVLSYCLAEVTLAASIMAFAIYALIKGIIAEGMMMLIYSVAGFIFSFIILSGYAPTDYVDIIMCIVMLACSISFLIRKDYMLFVSTFLLFIGEVLELSIPELYEINGIMLMLSGAIMIYYSVSRWIVVETGKEILPVI